MTDDDESDEVAEPWPTAEDLEDEDDYPSVTDEP